MVSWEVIPYTDNDPTNTAESLQVPFLLFKLHPSSIRIKNITTRRSTGVEVVFLWIFSCYSASEDLLIWN